jgi:hypothetical protein
MKSYQPSQIGWLKLKEAEEHRLEKVNLCQALQLDESICRHRIEAMATIDSVAEALKLNRSNELV